MIDYEGLIKPTLLIAGIFAIRFIAGVRVEKKKRLALVTPLMDAVILETTFTTRDPNDDPNLLEEMRDTLAHLNRQAYAEEFWGLDKQLCELHEKLNEAQRETMHRALLCMLNTEERWLQIVAAKTCASLSVTDALPRLKDLMGETLVDGNGAAGKRFHHVLADAVKTLDKPEE